MNEKYERLLLKLKDLADNSNELQQQVINNYVKGLNIMMKNTKSIQVMSKVLLNTDSFDDFFRQQTIKQFGFEKYNEAHGKFIVNKLMNKAA